MLALAKPSFNAAALANVTECIKSGWISSQGHFVTDFESAMAGYLGVEYAIATSSGTTALHLALVASGIGEYDKVLVPTFTFIATANVVKYCGAEPIFCDVDPWTWCLSTNKLECKCGGRVRVIIPVHINGYPCDMATVIELANEHNLLVIEDACQALGGTWEDKKLGTIGDIGCFSFFANKQLTTGEGGLCVTNDGYLARKIRALRDHGRYDKNSYKHDMIGYNYRMTNLQAAVGFSQVANLDNEVKRRIALYEQYIYILEQRAVESHIQPLNNGQSPWLFHYRLNESEVQPTIDRLSKVGVEAKSFYTSCHRQKPYCNSHYSLPVADNLFGVMLPLHDDVKGEDIAIIKEALA